ncbi:MAG: NUDIX domain-containing protein [Clostridiales bacterium]|nr:NUDIX domain-containing protein [Clostridiales bacterium]
MELWDLYDVNRRPLGKTMARGDKQPADTFRLVVHACIFNSDGKLLCQRRSPHHNGWSGMWDVSVGGHAISGETSLDAVLRETREELGLELSNNIIPALTINFKGGFDDFYCTSMDVKLSDCTIQESEVSEIAFLSLDEINAMIDSGVFIPRNKGFMEYLFYCRTRRGLVKEVCHEMNLAKEPYEKIVSGAKTIEMRLNDEKRQAVKVGDMITLKYDVHAVNVRVRALHRFDSFDELYAKLDLLKCGYSLEEVATAKYTDMLAYYTKEQQAKYGALGIEFEIISIV